MTDAHHAGWLTVEHEVRDEDLLRDAVASVMGETRGGVDIMVRPVGREQPEWRLGAVGLPGMAEPSPQDIDIDEERLRTGDVVTFHFRDRSEGAHYLAQWR